MDSATLSRRLAPFAAVAFGGGMVVNLIGLPPLLGFLAAGFILNGMGYENSPALSEVADLGVTLLLFTIGLKLNIKTLMRRDVWGTTSLHLLLSTLVSTENISQFISDDKHEGSESD